MTDRQDELPELQTSSRPTAVASSTVDDVLEAMKDVVDPELGINVVDLGLIYGVRSTTTTPRSST